MQFFRIWTKYWLTPRFDIVLTAADIEADLNHGRGVAPSAA
ncbi:MAG: hypothetical protein AAGA56_19910 [Myxococcota bacterium]